MWGRLVRLRGVSQDGFRPGRLRRRLDLGGQIGAGSLIPLVGSLGVEHRPAANADVAETAIFIRE